MADLAFLAPAETPVAPSVSHFKGHEPRPRNVAAMSAVATAPMALMALAAVNVARPRRSAQRRFSKNLKIVCQAEDEASVVTGQESEAEQIFREAYEAEAERAALMGKQLEEALAEQLGAPEGIKINIEAPAAPAPNEPGGTTWRKAYEDIKARAASLESQLQKARRLAEPTAASAFEERAVKAEASFDAESATQSTQSTPPPPQPSPQGIPADPMQQMQKLREIANISAEEESVLRLLSLAALANQEGMFKEAASKELPPLNQAREALSGEDFQASDALIFERCYVFPGVIPQGREPAVALEALQQRMRNLSASGAAETELFFQRQKEEGKSLLIMVHKSDLPDDKIEAWQWILWVVLLGLTFFACLSTPLAVQAVGPGAATGTDVTELVAAFGKVIQVIPIAFCILATVAAQETARRAVASKYGVELTPPYLIPAIPLGSVGCLGVVSRRTGTAPNRESEVNMSLAAPIAGFVVSIGLIIAGLTLGPDADNSMVNLNYQVLPVLLRFILKPFLGQSSVTTQPDPFADPTILAFPANPLLIGGACGLIVTALSLLPIGRLDGGVLARNALGSAAGPVGLAAWALLLYGSFGPDDAGALYFAFAFTVLIWQGGAEAPPKEAINEVTPGQQILSIVLVLAGLALTLPGYGFP